MTPWLEPSSSWVSQLAGYSLIATATYIYAIHKIASPRTGLGIFLSLITIQFLGHAWLSFVTKHASNPYLDEVFHIPQAQVYCDGKFGVWDDKITTPPGLAQLGQLRIASDARASSPYSVDSFWTGINVTLFPVLFFFSGLYYTDVLSTFTVLLAYINHLSRMYSDKPSTASNIRTIFLGLLALSVRQTNIFWVVVYMGGLEVVHVIKTLCPESIAAPKFQTLSEQISFYVWRYSLGDIHDPPLNLAHPIDLVLSAVSIGIASICNLGTIIRRQIWPHLIVLGAFVGFVIWNGGVVLGDKSNHVATLHLAQMLYIWPLFAFFSAPLFIPSLIGLAIYVLQIITGSTKSDLHSKKPSVSKSKPDQSAVLKAFNHIGSSHTLHSVLILAGALVITTLIVRYNTIVHPFTLADNRHFMFYIFRYTILRSWWIRYALVPVYVICGWLCWAALQGSLSTTLPAQKRQWILTPFSNEALSLSPPPTDKKSPNVTLTTADAAAIPPSTSTALILLAATFSLVTAPLVEPRYFILPWVFWRLLIPTRPTFPKLGSTSLISQHLVPLLETVWFLLINVATMYIFITRPFYWRGPDGELLDGGNVQRFMW
ncbi:Dol-P-Glc:Glc(2)Man(9)GlcNAc(2)-PP-Dol alpha-1,2-glucosyltransferase [Daldinia childiae]|uniref:Dol-P-Glc:Glc(2)Man(9)GlcNAc(2)-PP-Dol alpha-1,2-glucosyltransferase n=1 Tax=Daldinia childiae TaxID=326645 RepID=UPI0014480441|nr:Dol-P-Glc:Glc(2)Man(9)GlcNAc(2)-PP-Dol alpha-1,2-glucosyltransferase [Daldinia childiae]KAF3062345.1 Dol-P-Glc:Glc(2)Man(9)GlcNAc(2)-PP-Dol alpha-1,2-glucosyltransferase [Daldinia childiae]